MKKFLLIFGIIMGVVIIGAAGYGYYLYDSVADTASNMHEPVQRESADRDGAERADASSEEESPLSFLIMGVDNRENDNGRTDTMIVLTVNPEQESMKMVSIPRDTRTEIVGRGMDDKINHAYAFGGPAMAMDTVENFLDIPIDYFVTINMEGFQEIVDSVDGVTVNNPFAFQDNGYTFEEGDIDLDGEEALTYVRMRKEDPQGDFGRNTRQRQVVEQVIREGAQISSITRVGSMLEALGNNVRTNMSFDNMKDVQGDYRSARHNMDTLEITGQDNTIDGIYYLEVSADEKERISNELREHMDLS
ncbi:LCP family protein [Alteribacillus sp. HJP-4]|uniref:LCP family glycopolymer transferase n=1 Tax=Alteribacillus sp. HJP-4 TaxID=2775394 RepID=UPI0035CD13FD